ncbi:MAG TPA: AI-2E family transporter, partial [Alphaproteobacteria bacterium]|nr:AI-2E family transporter [Alphaproteobacteria bacterium]
MTGRQQLRYWVAALVATVLLVWLLRTILLPFIAGLAVAYLLDPLTDRLEARRVPRGWAAVLVLLLFFLLLIALALLLVPV